MSVTLIAEIGVNHNGSLEKALELIDAAKASGADAAKFQTFRAERLAAIETPKVPYQLNTTGPEESHLEMLRKLQLDDSAFPILKAHCDEIGIQFCSTPYSAQDAAFLDEIGVAFFKTASADLIDRPLHEYIAKSNRDALIATGMATMDEIEETFELYRENNATHRVTLLQCTSAYPADPADANLKVLSTLKSRFNCRIGYSDHTPDSTCSIAAVALGATVVEKHFTLDRSLPGPDHAASSTPEEFVQLSKAIRCVEEALGDGRKEPSLSELDMKGVSRKSIVASKDLPAGHVLSTADLDYRRPNNGLSPMVYPQLIGRQLATDVKTGEPLTLGHLAQP